MIAFPPAASAAIEKALDANTIFALCGTPGSGKKTLLKTMGYDAVHELDKMYSDENAAVLARLLQPNLNGAKVWVVYPAELLDKKAVERLMKCKFCKIILVSCEKVPLVPIVYMPQLDKKAKVTYLMQRDFPEWRARQIVEVAGHDLRQLNMHIQMPYLSSTDKLPHVYKDTLAILNGKELDEQHTNRNWLEQNAWADCPSISKLSEFYEDLVVSDMTGYSSILIKSAARLGGKRKRVEAPTSYKKQRLDHWVVPAGKPMDLKEKAQERDTLQKLKEEKKEAQAERVVFATDTYTLKRTATSHVGGSGSACVQVGPSAAHGGKQRKVVLVKSQLDFDTTFDRLGKDFAVHTFQGNDTTLSLVFKEKLEQVKDFDVYALHGKKCNPADIAKLWETIRCASFKSNIVEQALEIQGNMPRIEEAVEMYWQQGWKAKDWPMVHGNALKAKQEKTLSPFQRGVVTYGPDMKEMIECAAIVSQVMLPIPSEYHFIDDFIKERALNLVGRHLVDRDGQWVVEEIALKELLWPTQDEHGVYGLYKEKTLIFNGEAGAGKTEFVKGLASEFSSRNDRKYFGWGTICNFGAVTKAQQMDGMGCFVFDDFNMTTRGGNHPLTMEERKHLLYTKQQGHVAAFYATAVFPERMPRMWCINYTNQSNKGSWLSENFMVALKHLCEGDGSYFNGPDADQNDVSIGRRAVIFNVVESLFNKPAQTTVPLYSELAALETNATSCPF